MNFEAQNDKIMETKKERLDLLYNEILYLYLIWGLKRLLFLFFDKRTIN